MNLDDDVGPGITLMPVAWIKVACFAFALAIVSVFMMGRCSMPDGGLPPAVQTAIIRHEVKTVEDTAKVHRLEREAAKAKAREQAAKILAARADSAADAFRATADSLVTQAAAAWTAQDSANRYRLAEIARHQQADSLAAALYLQKVATAESDQRADSIEVAKGVETARANRADSTLGAVVAVVAEGKNGCRLLVVRCPTRKESFLGGMLAGVASVVVAVVAVAR